MSVAKINNWPWLHWQQRTPQAMAIDAGAQTLSWQQLAQEISSRAQGFSLQGVRPGMAVALRGHTGLEAVLSWLSLLALGTRVLTVNPRLPEAQLRTLLPDLDLAFSLNIDVPPCPQVPALSVRREAGTLNCAWDPDRLATLTLTSGTTGSPRAAAHRYAAHLHSASAVVELMGFTADDRWLLSLPMFHVSGLGILWRWLVAGATLVIDDRQDFFAALERCSFASLVPTQLWRLLNQQTMPSNLRAVLLGGATIPEALTQRAEAAGIRCWCGYGLTESASTVCAGRADGSGAVGAPLTGQELRLVAGEVWLRSPTLAHGYWQAGALTPLTDSQGWLHTGDLAHWQRGQLHIDGRRDNLFFSGGEAVQPEYVERILQMHPDVTQAVVLPVQDDEYGQRPVALVAGEVSVQGLSAWAELRLTPYQRPVAWYSLPAIGTGGIKHSRHRLAEWLAAQRQQEFPERAVTGN